MEAEHGIDIQIIPALLLQALEPQAWQKTIGYPATRSSRR
jgi:hypothetical protein